jgi:hypothetical protein
MAASPRATAGKKEIESRQLTVSPSYIPWHQRKRMKEIEDELDFDRSSTNKNACFIRNFKFTLGKVKSK